MLLSYNASQAAIGPTNLRRCYARRGGPRRFTHAVLRPFRASGIYRYVQAQDYAHELTSRSYGLFISVVVRVLVFPGLIIVLRLHRLGCAVATAIAVAAAIASLLLLLLLLLLWGTLGRRGRGRGPSTLLPVLPIHHHGTRLIAMHRWPSRCRWRWRCRSPGSLRRGRRCPDFPLTPEAQLLHFSS